MAPSRLTAPLARPPALLGLIERGEVLEHGRMQRLDAVGAILNDCAPRLPPSWQPPFEWALAELRKVEREVEGVSLVSVYARGSIPRGLGLPGRSDIDAIAFLTVADADAMHRLTLWREGMRSRTDAGVREFAPLICGMDLSLLPFMEASAIGHWLHFASQSNTSAPHGARAPRLTPFDLRQLDAFRVKTQGLCIYGTDFACRLPSFTPRQGGLIHGLRMDSVRAARAFDWFMQQASIEQAQEVGVWLAKRALRAGMEMVAEEVGGYSRDLLPCYEAMASRFAAKGPSTRTSVSLAALFDAQESTGEAVAVAAIAALRGACAPKLESCRNLADNSKPADRSARLEIKPDDASATEEAANLMNAAQELAQLLDHVNLAMDSRFTPLTSIEQLPEPPPLADASQSSPLPAVMQAANAARLQLLRWAPAALVAAAEHHIVEDSLPELQLPQLPSVAKVQWDEGSDACAASWLRHRRRRIEQVTRVQEQPLLLRGASAELGDSYLGPTSWNFLTLPFLIPKGSVRVSAGPAVVFCRDEHPMIDSGEFFPPSRVVQAMPTAEFLARLCRGSASAEALRGKGYRSSGRAWEIPPPLFYGDNERVYMQADVPSWLQAEWQVPSEWRGWGDARRAQPMRLWVSAHGSISPLHFDSAGSFLCQLRGKKRVVLFPPCAMDRLYPYPMGHPLFRRSRVDLYESVERRRRWFPAFDRDDAGPQQAVEALLDEGDVLLLPPLWWHHVETMSSLSVSVGARYV